MSRTVQSSLDVREASLPDRTRLRRLERMRRADPRLIDAALLGAAVTGAACLYLVYALRIGSFQPDEWYYMEIARTIASHFPAALWQQNIYWRGIQRIDQLVLAAPFALLRGAGVYQAAHVIQALLYASTAIPVWLLARAAGLARWSRMLAAMIVLLAPWAIVSTSFLEESAALPAYAWVLYATWRAAREPSRLHEVLAIMALLVATFSRTALLALAPILPLAMLWQQWRWDLRDKRLRTRARALPLALRSSYPIVTSLTVLALMVILVNAAGVLPGGGLSSLTGHYGIPKLGTFLGGLLSRYGYYLSRMAIGTGAIGMALALAWAMRTLAKPRDGARHMLAVVGTLGIGVVLLSLVQAGPDERYVLYGAVPIGVCFAAELDAVVNESRAGGRRWVYGHALSVLLGAAAVIGLIASASWPPTQSEYDFFTYPTATFYVRVVLGRLSSLPIIHNSTTWVYAGIAILAIGWIAIARRGRKARLGAAFVAVIMVGICSTELVYALQKFTTSPAAVSDGATAAERSWIERMVSPQATVAAVGIGLGQTPEYSLIWRTAEFWNTAIQVGAGFQPWTVPTLPFTGKGLTIAAESPSGLLHVALPKVGEAGYPAHLPRYLLLPRQATNPDGFAARTIAVDPALPLELVKLSEPARLEWSVAGTSEEGFMTSGQPATVTVYANALSSGNRCVRFALIGPPAYPGRWPYAVKSGNQTFLGGLVAQQSRSIEVRLHPTSFTGGKLATVTVKVRGKVPYPNGSEVSARLAGVSIGSCRA